MILGQADRQATVVRRLKRAAVGAAATMALVIAPLALGAVHPKTGYYTSSKSQKSVAFTVVKKGRKLEISYFTIGCAKGSVFLSSKSPSVSASGRFSYKGSARRFVGGTPAGSATLVFSGKFVGTTKVTGKASFSHTKLSGCPSKSFTAKLTK